MSWFLLSPFSITVLNVLCLLGLLLYFLSRNPTRSPATQALLRFMTGVGLVFASFFVIFSSVDPVVSTRAWWLLHLFVFPAVAMVQFAYHFPENLHPGEERIALRACLVPALVIYPYYLYRTLALTPTFAFEGFLYVFLDTPEVGVIIGLEITWMLVVFYRKAAAFEGEGRAAPPGPAAVLSPVDPRARLIRNMMLIFFSPLVVLVAVLMAYAGHLSWGLVGHILGSGLIVAAFLFAVLYINNCAEPSTFMVKLVGISLGAILIAFGLGASIALGVTEEAYDRERAVLIDRCLTPGGVAAYPAEVAYVLRFQPGLETPRVLHAPAALRDLLAGARRLDAPPGVRGYRQLDPLDAHRYFVAYPRRGGDALLEVGFSYLGYRRLLHGTCLRLLVVLVGTVALVLAVFPAFFKLTLLRPLHALLEGVGRVNGGDLDARVPVQVPDEIGYLSTSFNQMVGSVQDAERRLQDSLDYQVQLTDAYSCFFPRQFLEFLEKESVTEIRLGDNVQAEMSVLFSDIRSFTDMSERMTPQETFRFVNAYLGRVGPVVRTRGGFIDKFIGDAVMALFPRSPDDAVEAAVEMQRTIEAYNRELAEAGGAPIYTGIGIHTGPLMLGTIGEERRMEGTVISDAVNLASRIESLTKRYGAAVLISGETRARLEHPERFRLRCLDAVQVKGKRQAVELHEVLDGQGEELAAPRAAAAPRFEAARRSFCEGDFEAAQAAFGALAAEDPQDPAVALYLERCRGFATAGAPEGWTGVTTLTEK